MVSRELLLARAVFARSINLSGWQPGPQYPWSTISQQKKKRPTFEIHRTSDASLGTVALANQA